MGEPSSSWQNFNFRDDEGSAQGMQALRLLLAKLQEAQDNPRLKPSVNNLLMTKDLMLTSTQRLPSSVAPMHLEGGEGVPVMHGPMQANVVPHPLQGPLQTDGAKKKQYHGQERHVGKIREEGDFHDDDDEPPSRSRHKKRTNERRTKRSRRNSSGGSSSSSQSGRSSHGGFPKKGRKSPTPPTSPSSSPRGESSSEESSSTYKGRHPRRKHHAWKRAKKLKKFKEGGKSITFQTFDGSYGHVDKVLTFIQQFDAAFGGEDFTEASKLRNVAMHLTKSARHWWSTLCAKNRAPKTWKVCRLTIMKQFLDDDAEDNVLTAWRSLKFKEGESLQNYIEKFWDTCLKATVYRNINFSEKRQQFCAGLPEDMRTYVQALRPKTIAAVIHYTIVACKIFKPKNPPNKGDKGKDKENGSSNVKSNNKKQASKRPYQGTNRLSPEEMERYRKKNRCFRCGTTCHTYRHFQDAPGKFQNLNVCKLEFFYFIGRSVLLLQQLEKRFKKYEEHMQMLLIELETSGVGMMLEGAAPFREAAERAIQNSECDQVGAAAAQRFHLLDQQLRHQRALQQVGLFPQPPWRPQRGLPERSVSLLRAWLFDHFLHPYPKDTEKVLLARQAGLTRNQVSNWFINARVRLWKPMVEEMYQEEIKTAELRRTAGQGNLVKSTSTSHTSRGTTGTSEAHHIHTDQSKKHIQSNFNNHLMVMQDMSSMNAMQSVEPSRFCYKQSDFVNDSQPRQFQPRQEDQGSFATSIEVPTAKAAMATVLEATHTWPFIQHPNVSFDAQEQQQHYCASDISTALMRFGSSGGVTLTLGLQQHSGGGGSINCAGPAFERSPAGVDDVNAAHRWCE
ncbi:hypothetical protein L7F22_035086 [Adiantum nelumboides]|nr:hypothetical protein [Adiantum nelumboides]